MAERVVVLAGGTGGAKLVRGFSDVVGPEHLSAIVNTGDDIEIYGAYVSPDPDLVSFWLADLIDDLARAHSHSRSGSRVRRTPAWIL
jgi:2-phospho-L-lactate transferase/gluconeogenesis factor (CofD/UPF0052 family)